MERDKRGAKVLIEHPSSLVRLDLTEELHDAGYDVIVCAGPTGLHGEGCPLLAGDGCPLVEEADVVINALHRDQVRVYTAERATAPDTPVLVLMDDAAGSALELVFRDVLRAPTTTAGGELVALVDHLDIRPSRTSRPRSRGRPRA